MTICEYISGIEPDSPTEESLRVTDALNL